MIGADRIADMEAQLFPRQLRFDITTAELPNVAQDFGEKGRRAWFWCDKKWQVGRAWSVADDGTVNGMCRDYGPWGSPYPGSAPMETHCAEWLPEEVSWKKPINQYEQEPHRAAA